MRVLYVQRPRGGGSTTALVDLLRSIEESTVLPTVLFFGENRYEDQFRDLGVEVRKLPIPSGRARMPSAGDRPPLDRQMLDRLAREIDSTIRPTERSC